MSDKKIDRMGARAGKYLDENDNLHWENTEHADIKNALDTLLNSQDTDNNLIMKQSGSIDQLWGNELADRPAYTTISEPTAFTLLNATLDTWVTDGTNDWVEV